MMKCGLNATIIEYYGYDNITIQFEDGVVVKEKYYDCFKKGNIKNPNLRNYNFKDRTGERRQMNNGEYATIIEYFADNNITIQFDNGFIMKNRYYQNFKKGKVQSPVYKSLYGIGYIGIGEYKTKENNKMTSAYKAWINMFSRCYSESANKYFPTYVNCTVSEDFHCFQDFAKWYYDNMWGENIKFQIDKDILIKNNKVYSKDTCVLVDSKLNHILAKSSITNGEYPIGVYFDKRLNAFTPQFKIDGKKIYLGVYNNPTDAFYRYKEAKEKYIKEIADEYKDKYNDFPDKLYNALYNYEIDIND